MQNKGFFLLERKQTALAEVLCRSSKKTCFKRAVPASKSFDAFAPCKCLVRFLLEQFV